MTTRRRLFALTLVLLLGAAVLSSCGNSKSSGPDLVKGVAGIAGVTPADAAADRSKATDADALYVADGQPAAVAAKVTKALGDPSDTVNDAPSSYYLYRSGTVWVTEASAPGQSLVVIYKDNERATRSHAILATNLAWISTRNGFRGGSGGGGGRGGGNGFRGGGSGSGK